MWAFKVKNDNAAADTRHEVFKSITLRQEWNADLSNLGDIVLERDWVVVASNPKISGRDITFSIWDQIKNQVSATYYIKAIVNNQLGI